jgi:hypothetical protein
MYLGTTTWRKRNKHSLEKTKEVAVNLGLSNPVILDYGPGGAVDFLLDSLPEGVQEEWDTPTKLKRGIVKIVENLMRKTDLFPLKTSEPNEIAYVFNDLSPKCIYVIDSELKVIQAVQEMIKNNGLPAHLSPYLHDIEQGTIQLAGDIVIAYNVVERTRDFPASFRNIAYTTNIGGLLSTTFSVVPHGFKQIDDGLYQRLS